MLISLITTMSSYLLLAVLMGGMWNSFFCLFMLEFLSWLFVLLLSKDYVLKYLVVQVGFLLTGLLGVLFSKGLLVIAIFLKTGMPPFHLWFIAFASFMNKWVFFFFSSFHKLLPLFFLAKIQYMSVMLVLMVVMMPSGMMMLQAASLYYLMMMSSLMHFGWLIIMTTISTSITLMYWIFYSSLSVAFFKVLTPFFAKYSESSQSLVLSMVWLSLSGMPPFTMFWLKATVVVILIKIFFFSLVLLLVSILSIVSYYRAYHLSMSSLKSTVFGWMWAFMILSFMTTF